MSSPVGQFGGPSAGNSSMCAASHAQQPAALGQSNLEQAGEQLRELSSNDLNILNDDHESSCDQFTSSNCKFRERRRRRLSSGLHLMGGLLEADLMGLLDRQPLEQQQQQHLNHQELGAHLRDANNNEPADSLQQLNSMLLRDAGPLADSLAQSKSFVDDADFLGCLNLVDEHMQPEECERRKNQRRLHLFAPSPGSPSARSTHRHPPARAKGDQQRPADGRPSGQEEPSQQARRQDAHQDHLRRPQDRHEQDEDEDEEGEDEEEDEEEEEDDDDDETGSSNSTVRDLENILDKFEADEQLLLDNPNELLNCKCLPTILSTPKPFFLFRVGPRCSRGRVSHVDVSV